MIELSAEDINTIEEGIDDIIQILGQDCQIFYPPRFDECTNCAANPLTGASSGFYRHGGPHPFPQNGICPMCSGAGSIAIETSETIHCIIYFDERPFRKNDVVQVPGGQIQLKGKFTDAYKVQRANYVLPAGQNTKYRLSGEIIPINEVVKNRYFIAKLERV